MDMNEAVELERATAAQLASADNADEEELEDRNACARLVRLVESAAALMGRGSSWRHPNMTTFKIAVGDNDDCRELACRPGGVGSRLAVAAHTGLRQQLVVLLAEAGWSEREEVLCGPWRVQWRTEVASGRGDGELRIAGLIAEVHVADWVRATEAMERDDEDWLCEAAAGSVAMSRDGLLTVRDPFMWAPAGAGWVRRVLGVPLDESRDVPAYDWHLSAREARRVRERHRAYQLRDQWDVAEDLLDVAADLGAPPRETLRGETR